MRKAPSRGPSNVRVTIKAVCLSMAFAGVVLSAGCNGPGNTTTVSEVASTTTTDYIAETLAFPVDDYTIQTKKVGTADGMVNVKYHLYRHLAYVADPVDPDYQSLDVAVPVEIDGTAVDTDDAPILFSIAVNDYLASANLSPEAVASAASSTTTTGAPIESSTTETTCEEVDATTIARAIVDINNDKALIAGYVVVSPGCRGSDNVTDEGDYYGKAPAAIIDLKSAVKYIHFNDDVMPGSAKFIVAQGSGAGGGLAALLAASANSDLYQPYFDELGVADADDSVYACAAYSPSTDLNNADGAYEWQFGTTTLGTSLVDQTLSAQLASGFAAHLTSLDLVGQSGFGSINADNYGDYLVQTYLVPSANVYLDALSEEDREAYLIANPWLSWDGGSASFAWKDYVRYLGRTKDLPAFDAFDLSTPECRLFGDSSTDAKHFTDFSLQQTGEGMGPAIDPDLLTVTLDPDVQAIADLMNPMYFIAEKNNSCSYYWWIRQAAKDSETSLAVSVNLATGLENLGKEVHTTFYWEAERDANEDPGDFVEWIGVITSTVN